MKEIIEIILKAFDNTIHDVQNSYFYGYNYNDRTGILQVGIDSNMKKYIEFNYPDCFTGYIIKVDDKSGQTYIKEQ